MCGVPVYISSEMRFFPFSDIVDTSGAFIVVIAAFIIELPVLVRLSDVVTDPAPGRCLCSYAAGSFSGCVLRCADAMSCGLQNLSGMKYASDESETVRESYPYMMYTELVSGSRTAS